MRALVKYLLLLYYAILAVLVLEEKKKGVSFVYSAIKIEKIKK